MRIAILLLATVFPALANDKDKADFFEAKVRPLLASRCGDKRVPAIWISAGAPKLGWCWDGNPHTWLGAASAGARVAG